MNLSIDISQILKTYESMKHELSFLNSKKNLTSPKELREQLNLREIQLKSVIDISEKILRHFDFSNRTKTSVLADNQDLGEDGLRAKCINLEQLYRNAEECLERTMAEVKHLRSELEKLDKGRGNNNLFTVEVYQSEIEDLKKEHASKIDELQSKG